MEIRWPSWEHLEKLWARSKYGARVLSALGVLKLIFDLLVWLLDWKSRIKEAVETAGQLGPVFSVLLKVVISPWFGVALILLGVFYIAFVPAEAHPAEAHPAVGIRVVNAVAWITVGACVLLLWGALVAGYVAVHLPPLARQDTLKSCRITEEEKAGMAEELKAAGSFSIGMVRLPDADSSCTADLLWILKKADWKVDSPIMETWDEPMPGLYILVPVSSEIPAGAEILARVFKKHSIEFSTRPSQEEGPGSFSLLVGSRP